LRPEASGLLPRRTPGRARTGQFADYSYAGSLNSNSSLALNFWRPSGCRVIRLGRRHRPKYREIEPAGLDRSPSPAASLALTAGPPNFSTNATIPSENSGVSFLLENEVDKSAASPSLLHERAICDEAGEKPSHLSSTYPAIVA